MSDPRIKAAVLLSAGGRGGEALSDFAKAPRIFYPITWIARVARNKALDNIKSPTARHNAGTLGVKALDDDNFRPLQIAGFSVYFNGYTHVESAEALCVPPGTVKTKNRMVINTPCAIIQDRPVLKFV